MPASVSFRNWHILAYSDTLLANETYVLEVGKVVLEGPGGKLIGNKHVREAYSGVKGEG